MFINDLGSDGDFEAAHTLKDFDAKPTIKSVKFPNLFNRCSRLEMLGAGNPEIIEKTCQSIVIYIAQNIDKFLLVADESAREQEFRLLIKRQGLFRIFCLFRKINIPPYKRANAPGGFNDEKYSTIWCGDARGRLEKWLFKLRFVRFLRG